MKDIISEAIDSRRLLEFIYDGHRRVVEPHTFGVSRTGKDTLAAFQVEGTSSRGVVPAWAQFTVDKIEGLKLVDQSFADARPGYTRGDSRMKTIYNQI